MAKVFHYLGDSEYDTAMCGEPQLGGGILEIETVTCLNCLHKLVDMGSDASKRLAVLANQVLTHRVKL